MRYNRYEKSSTCVIEFRRQIHKFDRQFSIGNRDIIDEKDLVLVAIKFCRKISIDEFVEQ